MNKKFSTLLAGLLLTTSAAFAQLTDVNKDIKLSAGANDELYQIAMGGGDSVLIVRNDTLLFKHVDSITAKDVASSLWCVHVDTTNQGQAPKFDFTNRQTGSLLEINRSIVNGLGEFETSGPIVLGGDADVNGWMFSPIYKDGLKDSVPLYSYITADTVIALEYDLNNDRIVATKCYASDVQLIQPQAMFRLIKPKAVVLDAYSLNTMFGTNPGATFFKLLFDKDKKTENNVFANRLVAKDSPFMGKDGKGGYVYVQNQATNNYLRVDSAYHADTGSNNYLMLTDTTTAAAFNAKATLVDTAQYSFRFEYLPYADSLIILAGVARDRASNSLWTDTIWARESLFVGVVDSVVGDKGLLTLVAPADSLATHIRMGFSCGGSASDTTIVSDLYVIKGASGKYLAAPIYADSAVRWVTLEKNMDPWTMPSFQWVVEQQRNTPTSRINLTNREFDKLVIPAVQLHKMEGTPLVYDNVEDSLKLSGFEAATIEIKQNSYLGYKYVDTLTAKATRYQFRYLHELADDKYIGVNEEENDSVMYVGDTNTLFSLAPVGDKVKYGYTSTKVDSLKPLYRQVYTLKVRNPKLIYGATADSVVLDKEGRFATSVMQPPVPFLFKANNYKEPVEKADGEEGTLFYAFIKLGGDTLKAGVDDNNLWIKSQIMTESRTSAFTVEVADVPLYRRFNTEKEGAIASDDPDTVKFFRVNNPQDMLFEDAHSNYAKGPEINFLGVSNNIQFPDASRSIYVDTAYVNRGAGLIKPQYMLAVGVHVQPGSEAIPCPLEHNHGYDKDGNELDKWTCSHATPGTDGYVRGRYLINAVDSAKAGDWGPKAPIRDADYIWNNQVRLAFVEAIHKGDTLYILKGDTAKWADPVDLSKLQNDTTSLPNKIRLDNNDHKNVVFSFRLLEEGNDDFLIESQNTDGEQIAPMEGGWIKIQNGVPVISYAAFDNAPNEAEIFNVTKTADAPTANEGITATEVTITAVAGGVQIKNAEGKAVTISNILGKTVANVTLTSDSETINVPAGIVVVAVEGEEAVKAVVK